MGTSRATVHLGQLLEGQEEEGLDRLRLLRTTLGRRGFCKSCLSIVVVKQIKKWGTIVNVIHLCCIAEQEEEEDKEEATALPWMQMERRFNL